MYNLIIMCDILSHIFMLQYIIPHFLVSICCIKEGGLLHKHVYLVECGCPNLDIEVVKFIVIMFVSYNTYLKVDVTKGEPP